MNTEETETPLAQCLYCGKSFIPSRKNNKFDTGMCSRAYINKKSYEKHRDKRVKYAHDRYNRIKETDEFKKKRYNYFRDWYLKNKARQIQQVQDWKKLHPDKVSIYSKRRYQKRKALLQQ